MDPLRDPGDMGSIIGESAILHCKSSLEKVLISTGCFFASPVESNPVF